MAAELQPVAVCESATPREGDCSNDEEEAEEETEGDEEKEDQEEDEYREEQEDREEEEDGGFSVFPPARSASPLVPWSELHARMAMVLADHTPATQDASPHTKPKIEMKPNVVPSPAKRQKTTDLESWTNHEVTLLAQAVDAFDARSPPTVAQVKATYRALAHQHACHERSGKAIPFSERLLPLFLRARALAQKLHISEWIHHYRDCNKMADKAANVAMDTRRSFQAHAYDNRPELATIVELLQNDVRSWVSRRIADAADAPAPLR